MNRLFRLYQSLQKYYKHQKLQNNINQAVLMEDYEVTKELGSGSFGRVYKVVRKQDKKIMAMKQIKMKQLNARQKQNALNEVRLLASIKAPNIIKYYGAFFEEKNNLLCIIMQYANGGDLAGVLKKKVTQNSRIKEDLVWKITHDLLKGMQIMHKNKIIHRDIKPANVFIADGVAKHGDMNVSKVMEGKFATTQTGTPYYTSPEIWQGKKYDSKCDVWSLGCLIYELCQLRPPFMAKDFPGLSKKVLAGYYDPISSTYSKKLSALIRRCLTVDQARRPTAAELLMEEVFMEMDQLDQGGDGQVQMLDTIRCPKVLMNLNKQLPQGEQARKMVTMKKLDGQSRNQHDANQRMLSMKKIRSEKQIGRPTSIQKENQAQNQQNQGQNPNKIVYNMPPKQEYQGIIDKLKNPMQSPQGIVKLPRINSYKRL